MIDYEAEYNNRVMVPEHPEIIAGWERDAAAYRESASCDLDRAYGLGPRLFYDLFHPTGGTEANSIALFLHGGYWQSLDRKHFSHMARGLNAHGYTVCVASYDLCPEVRVGDIVSEIRSLAEYLWETYRKPILSYGHSAGGHLTAALLATDWRARRLPPALARAGLAISGLFDLVPLLGTSVNKALGMDQKEAVTNSPITMGIPYGTKLIATVGGAESKEYKRQSRVIVDFWNRGGTEATLHEEAGANHFTVIASLADTDSSLVHDLTQLGK
ncbi:alpha/beta hydrolase [Breoghania sp.]|uniref:alpha/beta hydrolase n=1 Tax=Breoghania sp. TaxID=2065378 RepID=UPI00261AE329|nr:alpha/beta hydrolase [Breoghania sp.]MDJ0931868.1 alpha/beta hydrolase [Breoghania sp.]